MTKEKNEGGVFGGADDLYREVIVEHFRCPKNKGLLVNNNIHAEGMNPLCGDQIVLSAIVENNVVKEVRHQGHGCAISQAAASMMTELVRGKTIDEIQGLASAYKNIFGVENDGSRDCPFTVDDLGDAVALEGVKKYPVRIKCALLSWNTLLQCLDEHKRKKP